MLKYCFILDEEKGTVQLGAGCPDEYYIEIGMQQRDVDQSDIDFQWYLTEKCPKKSEEQKLQDAKTNKYNEANRGAKLHIEEGKALYELTPTRHIEATDGNIGKFTSFAFGYISGEITSTVTWNTKEDENIELNQQEVQQILTGLNAIQTQVWTVKFPYYKNLIDNAQTVAEVEAIEIDYDNETF